MGTSFFDCGSCQLYKLTFKKTGVACRALASLGGFSGRGISAQAFVTGLLWGHHCGRNGLKQDRAEGAMQYQSKGQFHSGPSSCPGSGRALPCVCQFLNVVGLLWKEWVVLAPKPLIRGGSSTGLTAEGCLAIVPAAEGTGLRC